MEVKLSRWQTQVWDDKSRYKVINAGRRSGKSYLVSLKMIDHAVRNKGNDIWYVAPQYKQAKLIMWEMIKELLPVQAIEKTNETELIIILKNKSRIMLKGADNPDSLRGVKIDLCIFDEAAFIDKWDEVWKVMRPTLMDSVADVWWISTPDGWNHFKDLTDTAIANGDWTYYHFTTYDNPYIKKEEIEQLRADMDSDAFDQEIMGEFVKRSGLVYPEFKREKHVKDISDFQAVYYLRGCDRGYRNPTAVPLIAVDKDDVWYQMDEIYETQLTNPQLFKRVNELRDGDFELSTMDSAQAGDIEELNNMGHDWIPVKKQSGETNVNYVRWKIQKFSERIASNGYFVNPKCENTINEFERYSWKDDREGENKVEEPFKVYDHMMDAVGDLNAMYEHYYKPKKKNPWDNKPKGTYIPPSPGHETDDDIVIINTNEWDDEV